MSESEEKRFATVDAGALREVCGRILTGVAVMTCQNGERKPVGITVNSFASVSLDPSLVLLRVRGESRGIAAVRESGALSFDIPAADQAAPCRAFARRETAGFGGLAPRPAVTGVPVLSDAPARPDRRSPAAFPAGGHETVVAEAVDLSPLREEQPLAFRRGGRPCPEALV